MTNTFTAIDFETAMNHHICSVGIVSFENGVIVDEFHQLIQPPGNNYNWHTTKVHGLTSRDTRFSPRFHEVYPAIRERLFGNTIVAHNESFDRRVLTKTMQDYRIPYHDLNIAEQWECTLKIYKSKGYKPANLNACCQRHGIQLQHHEALSDARACGKLFLLSQAFGNQR